MKRSGAQIQRLAAGGRRVLLAAGILLTLSGCGKEQEDPWSPPPPPRPVTEVSGHVTTAQLELTARPVAPPPGQM